jgi:hypothetical protein
MSNRIDLLCGERTISVFSFSSYFQSTLKECEGARDTQQRERVIYAYAWRTGTGMRSSDEEMTIISRTHRYGGCASIESCGIKSAHAGYDSVADSPSDDTLRNARVPPCKCRRLDAEGRNNISVQLSSGVLYSPRI